MSHFAGSCAGYGVRYSPRALSRFVIRFSMAFFIDRRDQAANILVDDKSYQTLANARGLQDYGCLRIWSVTILRPFHYMHCFLVDGTPRWKAPELLKGDGRICIRDFMYVLKSLLWVKFCGVWMMMKSVRHFGLSEVLLSRTISNFSTSIQSEQTACGNIYQ